MDHDTPISFLLPSPQDEGIFPLALLTSMVEWHNEIVQNVKDVRTGDGPHSSWLFPVCPDP